MYTNRLKETIGAYALLLNGIDALVFTDDIGVQNPPVRQAACEGLQWAGILLDENINQSASSDQISLISTPAAPVKVLTVPTDEERVIAMEGNKLINGVGYDHS
jgi:acetate kinase